MSVRYLLTCKVIGVTTEIKCLAGWPLTVEQDTAEKGLHRAPLTRGQLLLGIITESVPCLFFVRLKKSAGE
jgi:hypothetical protein